MKKLMKISMRIAFTLALLTAGFAAGFPAGQRTGFTTGIEWAIVQAGIVAREAGVIMPVTFESGNFRVTLRQPQHLYTTAWKLADRHEAATQCMKKVEKDYAVMNAPVHQ